MRKVYLDVESEKAQTEELSQEQTSSNAEKAEPDYKALYEEAKKHSREWEKRAKANKGAVEQWNDTNAELNRAATKIAELSADLEKKESQLKHRQMAEKISKNTGIPADMLIGETEEDMSAWANKLDEYIKQKQRKELSIKAAGKFEKIGSNSQSSLEDFAKQLLGKN